METLNLIQGSEEWLAIRAQHFTASEASAMLGLSKYMSRQELLRQKATGYMPDVDSFKQRLFDAGHDAEDKARPIAESIIGQTLYPATGRLVVDGLPLLASFDGITMDEEECWENKLFNQSLASDLEAGHIDDHYWPQLEQQLLVSGANRVYFTASDGTLENTIGMWYQSVPKRRQQLIAGWKQFAEDMANYQHVEQAPAAVAAPIKELPALIVQITGQVSESNLEEWKSVVTARIDSINTDLQNDQDFADAATMVNFLGDGEKKIDLVKSQAQAQAAPIDTLFRALDEIKESMKAKRLELNRLVEARKVTIRAEILAEGKTKLADHIAELNKKLARVQMPVIKADFEGAMRSKKSVASLRESVNNEFLRAQRDADDIAKRIQINLATLDEQKDHAFLFNDLASLVMKASDDLANVIKLRISEHQAEQNRKLEAERERIRKEEQERADKEAAAKAVAAPTVAETVAAVVPAPTTTAAAAPQQAEQKQALNPAGAWPFPSARVAAVDPHIEQDTAWKIAGLVSGMQEIERVRVLQFCERVIEQRKEVA